MCDPARERLLISSVARHTTNTVITRWFWTSIRNAYRVVQISPISLKYGVSVEKSNSDLSGCCSHVRANRIIINTATNGVLYGWVIWKIWPHWYRRVEYRYILRILNPLMYVITITTWFYGFVVRNLLWNTTHPSFISIMRTLTKVHIIISK